ncbi:hypothetical protein HYH02_010998 [Chlamydomonas schloesseri]|uniref:Uncharacterized protein n=1 Tax=Chlamydomonas schloesseri TaxID=2026947 RepID=A0A835T6F8_9CHLO|nr:hypothetical protein HYH02_010998 [Chlamydomonas schloesseri]|eukprot:KAG2438301.1 hypothetical protein HYH02_010998 [Chlamydomonas schloesseri]
MLRHAAPRRAAASTRQSAIAGTTSLCRHRGSGGGSGYSRGAGSSRGRLQVVAYRSELSDMLLQRATRYAELTAAAGSMTRQELASQLGPLVGPRGVAFLADGVIYRRDRKRDVGQLVEALGRQHRAYKHLVYRPVVSAVNEEQGVVFTAVYWVLQNSGEPLFGAKEPSGRISKGFLIDKLSFDKRSGGWVGGRAGGRAGGWSAVSNHIV